MRNVYEDDSLSLHTDAYQVNMTETYWHDNMHNRKAVFERKKELLPLMK
ncbi:hypothetical protein [Halalkalibacter lacteus]